MAEKQLHEFRKEIDALIVKAEKGILQMVGGREMAIAHVKLQEAKMWVGKVLEAKGTPFPPELADKSGE